MLIDIQDYAGFAVLQSHVHEVWVRFFGSTLKDDLRYTPSDVFETFPFPADWRGNIELTNVGSAYFERRAEIMRSTRRGLTETYNRFHDPSDRGLDIKDLRCLHTELNRAVLKAFGWNDLAPDAAFEAEWTGDEVSGSVRFSFSQETHDAVLTRLLDRNSRLANEMPERRNGSASDPQVRS